MNITSRILQFIPKDLMMELNDIALDKLIPDNNTKVDKMVAALDRYNIDYQELAPGTNRYAILIDGYVFKIGLDKAGIRDNWAELSLSQELQPFVIKVYECNGLINVSEYVTVISKTEFQESKEEVRQILSHLAQGYLLGDVGAVNKNFMNWGYREDGQLVILDFAYIYRVVGDEMMCQGLNKDDTICEEFLEYDENFHELICPKCRKKYTFHDIRRRIDKDFEQKELDMIKQTSYKVTKPNTDVADISKEAEQNEVEQNTNKDEGEEIMGKKKHNKVSVQIDYDPIEAYNEAVAFTSNMYNGNTNYVEPHYANENNMGDGFYNGVHMVGIDLATDTDELQTEEDDNYTVDYDNFDEDRYESVMIEVQGLEEDYDTSVEEMMDDDIEYEYETTSGYVEPIVEEGCDTEEVSEEPYNVEPYVEEPEEVELSPEEEKEIVDYRDDETVEEVPDMWDEESYEEEFGIPEDNTEESEEPVVEEGCDTEEAYEDTDYDDSDEERKDLISELISDSDDEYYPDDSEEIVDDETFEEEIEVDEGCPTENAEGVEEEYEETLLSDNVEIDTDDDYKEPIYISDEVPGVEAEEVGDTGLLESDEVLDVEHSEGFQIVRAGEDLPQVDEGCDIPQSYQNGQVLILSDDADAMRNELMSGIDDDYDDSYDDLYDDNVKINQKIKDGQRRKNC